jgi:hypothetical protein
LQKVFDGKMVNCFLGQDSITEIVHISYIISTLCHVILQ